MRDGVAKRWNHFFEGMRNITIVNQFKNKLRIGRIPLIHLHLGRWASIKTHCEA